MDGAGSREQTNFRSDGTSWLRNEGEGGLRSSRPRNFHASALKFMRDKREKKKRD